MFARALIAFLVLPGTIAFALPALWLAVTGRLAVVHPWGLVLFGAGVAGLLACVRDFYVAGRGTLAPWSPPEKLVVVGLYRHSRNPMYVSVVAILAGWAATCGALDVLFYAAFVAAGFHLRVVSNEEPFLARAHGEAWDEYCRRVRRWL